MPDIGQENSTGVEAVTTDKPKSIILPVGITINSLRRAIPLTSQLVVLLERKNTEGEIDNRVIQIGGAQLHPGLRYMVNVNPDKYGSVYLNPIEPSETVPEDSNISQEVDLLLAGKARTFQGSLSVVAESPDTDLQEAIVKIEEYAKWTALITNFDTTINALPEQELNNLVHKTIQAAGLVYERGWNNHAFIDSIYYDAQDLFVLERVKGTDISVQEVLSRCAEGFVGRVKAVIQQRVPQLKNTVKDPNQMAFSIDKYKIGEEKPNEGRPIVMTYFPGVGWSCAVPNGDCPLYAVNTFDALIQGTYNPTDDVVLEKSIQDEGDSLSINRGESLVTYSGLQNLRESYAVYHPGRTIKEALETIRAMGHPHYGELVFKRILFKDTSEQIIEEMPPLDLSNLGKEE